MKNIYSYIFGVIGIVSIIILYSFLSLQKVSSKFRGADTIPRIEITFDEPLPNAGNIRSQLELLTGGGLYKDREIDVTVTTRTLQENRDVFKEFNVKIISDKANLTTAEKNMVFEKMTK